MFELAQSGDGPDVQEIVAKGREIGVDLEEFLNTLLGKWECLHRLTVNSAKRFTVNKRTVTKNWNGRWLSAWHLTERRYILTCKLTTTMLTKGQLLFLIVRYLTKNLSEIQWTLFVQYAAIFNRQKGTHCCREITCFRDNFHCVTLPVRCTNPVVVTNFRPRSMSHEILRSGVRTKWLRFSTNHIQCKRGDVLSPSVRRSLSLYEGEEVRGFVSLFTTRQSVYLGNWKLLFQFV